MIVLRQFAAVAVEVIGYAYRKARGDRRGRPGGGAGRGAGRTGRGARAGVDWRTPWGGSRPDEEQLASRRSSERFHAWKWAHIVLEAGEAKFRGVSINITYQAEDVARCAVLARRPALFCPDDDEEIPYHTSPNIACACGFYGLKQPAIAMFRPHQTPFFLEVEFAGKVVVCEHGYRAGKIRVLGVTVAAECSWQNFHADHDDPCSRERVVVFQADENMRLSFAAPWCRHHAETIPTVPNVTRRIFTLPELRNMLGTDLRWAPEE